jgi:hypothetical protein
LPTSALSLAHVRHVLCQEYERDPPRSTDAVARVAVLPALWLARVVIGTPTLGIA